MDSPKAEEIESISLTEHTDPILPHPSDPFFIVDNFQSSRELAASFCCSNTASGAAIGREEDPRARAISVLELVCDEEKNPGRPRQPTVLKYSLVNGNFCLSVVVDVVVRSLALPSMSLLAPRFYHLGKKRESTIEKENAAWEVVDLVTCT